LIVVAIIGIIAAIAVPNLLTAIQRSKRSRTAADLRAIGTALGSYQVDENQFPDDAGDNDFGNLALPEAYYQGATKDAWGVAFQYDSDDDEQGYTLESYGKDRGDGWTNSEFDSDIVYINGSFMAPASLVER
jgi:general secretion pathway protein G